ncbi:methyltransferase domain-containing protein [Pseudonocardia kujensis]|uniref:class I SAM-dependent methyltransferase n=1 Tax=Pseudonocardia kujensis TaxID=1128675 RepID=UPI001E4EEB7E|nr:methyltransferase domain-containing protein [Pseudonocardia kujensis]MCE0766734.1 methyltransferase domain-containing protein [Pseudonocardia kujensis]
MHALVSGAGIADPALGYRLHAHRRVVLAGDAAHCASPVSGMSTTLALAGAPLTGHGDDVGVELVEERRLGLGVLRPAGEVPFDEVGDELLPPHWAELWPSALALAAEPFPAGARVLEIGCGLGLPALAAARAGADVLATDLSATAVDLVRRSADRNGLDLRAEARSWSDPALEPVDLVLGADLLYGHRNVVELLEVLPPLAPEVWLTDPGRPLAPEFLAAARTTWTVTSRPTGQEGVALHRLVRGST